MAQWWPDPLGHVRETIPSTRWKRSHPFVHIVIRVPPLWTQQHLDGGAPVHRAIALRHLIEGQGQVEDLAEMDRLSSKSGRSARAGSRSRGPAPVQVDLSEEQLMAGQLHVVEDPNGGQSGTGRTTHRQPAGQHRALHRAGRPGSRSMRTICSLVNWPFFMQNLQVRWRF